MVGSLKVPRLGWDHTCARGLLILEELRSETIVVHHVRLELDG